MCSDRIPASASSFPIERSLSASSITTRITCKKAGCRSYPG